MMTTEPPKAIESEVLNEPENLPVEDNGADNAEEPQRPWPAWALKLRNSWLLPALLFALLVLIATWPMSFMVSHRFIGDYQGDFWKHCWGHWWVKESLVSGVLPLFCRLLNAPSGGYIFIADPVNCLIDGAMMTFLPLVTAYNTLILLNLWGGCMAAWALTRYFVKDSWASMVTGAVYGLSAYVLAYPVRSGVTETLNTAWIPLCLLFIHRTVDKGRVRDVVGLGVFFFLTAFSCWYYGEFMVVYAAVILFHRFCRGAGKGRPLHMRWGTWRGRRAWASGVWERLRNGWMAIRMLLLKVAAGIALGAILVMPYAVMFQLVISDPANIVMPDRAPKRSIFRFKDYLGSNSPWSISARGVSGFHNYTNLVGFFLPGKGNATVTVTIDRLTRVHYLGWIALGMAWVGIKRRKELSKEERSEMRYWLIVGIFFLLLSLGPRVIYSDFAPDGFINPLYLAMYVFFPMFHKLAIPFRFLALGLICLGIIGSFGLKRLMHRQNLTFTLSCAVFVPLAMVLETALVSPLPWPMSTCSSEIPAVYEMIVNDPEPCSIIDYPFERFNSQLVPGEYFYYQTYHKHSIPYRTSGVLSSDVARSTFMEEVSAAQNGLAPSKRSVARVVRGAQRLRAMGFKYIIFHSDLLPGLSMDSIEKLLTPILGEPVRFADGVVSYVISPVPKAVKVTEAYENSGEAVKEEMDQDPVRPLVAPIRKGQGIMGDQPDLHSGGNREERYNK